MNREKEKRQKENSKFNSLQSCSSSNLDSSLARLELKLMIPNGLLAEMAFCKDLFGKIQKEYSQ